MSRYDGLIIPRSYSEYINKTDAATLQQALQLSGVLSEAVAAGDNKAVKSSAVNAALANEKKSNYNTTITDCNNAYAEGSMSRYVLNGAITSNLPDTTSIYIVESISSNSTVSENNYGYQIATKIGNISKNGDRYIRYRNSANKTWGNWEKIITSTELNKVQDFWNIFLTQAITETTPTVKASYSGRKFTDYPLLIFTIGASEKDVRNTIVFPSIRFSSTGDTVFIRAYSYENYVELSISWRSDTEITVNKTGTAGFTPYLNILGYGSFN